MHTLNQWLERIESLHPQHIELTLDRVQQVGDSLGVTDFSQPVVCVAGTNGKGSVVASLSALVRASGKTAASYTSPHLVNFTERLTINGVELSEQRWCEAFEKVDESRNGIRLTYFEFTTLAALWLLKHTAVDIIILEIGLGGRLDAVNSVTNDIAIITSIGFDHEDWLGNTLVDIAREKAGIIQANSKVIVANEEVARLVKPTVSGKELIVANQSQPFDPEVLALVERFKFQIYPDSFFCALAAAQLLKIDLRRLNSASIETYLELKGRWQQFKPFSVWCDVAHNPQATAYLLKKIKSTKEVSRWHFIVGMLKDKRALNSLSQFAELNATWSCITTEGPRGLEGAELASLLSSSGFTAKPVSSIDDGVAMATGTSDDVSKLPSDTGLVAFGSFLVVAKMIEYMKARQV